MLYCFNIYKLWELINNFNELFNTDMHVPVSRFWYSKVNYENGVKLYGKQKVDNLRLCNYL